MFQRGIQRYFPRHVLIVSASHFNRMNFQRVVLQVSIRPYRLFCFTDSRAGERQKSDEIRAIFRLRCTRSFDQGYEAVKLFRAWQPDRFFKNIHAPDFVSGIIVVRESCQFGNTAEGIHSVVKN